MHCSTFITLILNVYGTNDHEIDLLRSKSGGKLKVTAREGEDMLPKCHNYGELYDEDNGLESCHQPCGEDCFGGG